MRGPPRKLQYPLLGAFSALSDPVRALGAVSASILARPVQIGNSAALVPSSSPVAGVALFSDKPPPIGKKSLFDAVPCHSTFICCAPCTPLAGHRATDG
jgi:hypothetical protein